MRKQQKEACVYFRQPKLWLECTNFGWVPTYPAFLLLPMNESRVLDCGSKCVFIS